MKLETQIISDSPSAHIPLEGWPVRAVTVETAPTGAEPALGELNGHVVSVYAEKTGKYHAVVSHAVYSFARYRIVRAEPLGVKRKYPRYAKPRHDYHWWRMRRCLPRDQVAEALGVGPCVLTGIEGGSYTIDAKLYGRLLVSMGVGNA